MVICLERVAYGPADAIATHSLSLASVKLRLVLPFWYRLNRVVLDKGPLEGVCVCVFGCDVGLQLQWHPAQKRLDHSYSYSPAACT